MNEIQSSPPTSDFEIHKFTYDPEMPISYSPTSPNYPQEEDQELKPVNKKKKVEEEEKEENLEFEDQLDKKFYEEKLKLCPRSTKNNHDLVITLDMIGDEGWAQFSTVGWGRADEGEITWACGLIFSFSEKNAKLAVELKNLMEKGGDERADDYQELYWNINIIEPKQSMDNFIFEFPAYKEGMKSLAKLVNNRWCVWVDEEKNNDPENQRNNQDSDDELDIEYLKKVIRGEV